jgi:hypothetical protein
MASSTTRHDAVDRIRRLRDVVFAERFIFFKLLGLLVIAHKVAQRSHPQARIDSRQQWIIERRGLAPPHISHLRVRRGGFQFVTVHRHGPTTAVSRSALRPKRPHVSWIFSEPTIVYAVSSIARACFKLQYFPSSTRVRRPQISVANATSASKVRGPLGTFSGGCRNASGLHYPPARIWLR